MHDILINCRLSREFIKIFPLSKHKNMKKREVQELMNFFLEEILKRDIECNYLKLRFSSA